MPDKLQNRAQLLQKPLDELEKSDQFKRAGLLIGDTAYHSLEFTQDIPETLFMELNSEDLIYLSKSCEQKFDTRNKIVCILMGSPENTDEKELWFETESYLDIEAWPVTAEFADMATETCLEFCNSHGLTDILRQCLEQVKENFGVSEQEIQAELSYFYDDEELDNEPHVAIEVKVSTSQETAENNYDKWLDWFVGLSASDRKFFILTIDRV